jgi:hypothetical protein
LNPDGSLIVTATFTVTGTVTATAAGTAIVHRDTTVHRDRDLEQRRRTSPVRARCRCRVASHATSVGRYRWCDADVSRTGAVDRTDGDLGDAGGGSRRGENNNASGAT